MSTLEPVAELADGGYWYVVDAVPDPDQGGQTPGVIPGIGWCAWYANGKAVIRCPNIIAGLPSAPVEQVEEILTAAGYTGKPFGRIGGV
jgi:hypothetical protein